MAYFMTTPLGRDVPLNDWSSYYQDHILGLLYDFAQVLSLPLRHGRDHRPQGRALGYPWGP